MAHRFGASDQTLGGKLAPKIALLVGRVLEDHLRRTGGHRAQIGADAAVKFFRTITVERDAHWQPVFDHMLEHDELPDELRSMLQFMAHHHGEGAALGALSMVGGVANSTFSAIFNPILLPITHKANYNHPFVLLDPATLAQLTSRGMIDEARALSDARGSGLPEADTDHLIELSKSRPSPDVLVEFLRRGEISEAEFDIELHRQGFEPIWQSRFRSLRFAHFSPEDLALQVLKGIRTEKDVEREAGEAGASAEHLRLAVLMTGEPLGLEQLQEAYRRGYIDKARLEHGIRQSRVRDEWTDVVEKLRFTPASPSDALRGVVQNHLSDAEGKRIAEAGGLDPADWRWLVETEGNPAATGQMIQLWNRGVVSQAQVEQSIRESRVKDKYVPALLHLKRRLPAERQIVNMVTRGSIGQAEAAKLFHELGYDTPIAQALVHAASSSQVVREKQLAKGEVEQLFYDHAISQAEAVKLLVALGYSAHNATFLLHLVDLKRHKALQDAAMAPIRSAYLARHIGEAEASKQLDALGIEHEQRDFALHLWSVDREAHRRMLTPAEITKANEQGLLSDPNAESRLTELGYTASDARLLLDLEKGRVHPAP